MIRPLRRRHRWMIIGVGLLVGAWMLLGLLGRRAVPTVDDLPLAVGQEQGSRP